MKREEVRASRLTVYPNGICGLKLGGKSEKVVYFDAEDIEKVMKYSWSECPGRKTTYAQANIGGRMVRMHRYLMDAPDGTEVDHQDRDGLNNRRYNLRIATSGENKMNSLYPTNGSSGLRGVTFQARNSINPWQARIGCEGKKIQIGSFPTIESAARAYDAKAIELYGEFATLNYPEADLPEMNSPE
jgi:hypothetical protein